MARTTFVPGLSSAADLNTTFDWAAYETHPAKANARVASIANVAISTAVEHGDTIDGVTLAVGDRILLKNQTNAYENGIYVVQNTGAAVRAVDANTDDKVNSGIEVYVEEGTSNGGKKFKLATTGVIILNTTDLSFTELGGSGGSVPTGTGVPKIVSGVQQAAASLIVNADVASDAAIAESKLALASDAVAGTASRRTLGTGAQQAAAGNHTHSLATASTLGFMSGTDKTRLDAATASPTASTLMARDVNGRAQVAAPSADADVATKKYVDDATTAGAPDADLGTKGITELSVAPVGEPIAVGDNDPRLQEFGASGPGHSAGLAPSPGATPGSSKFLREDRTWAVPPGGSLSVAKFGEAPVNDVSDITVKGGNVTDDEDGAITVEFTPATIGAAEAVHTHAISDVTGLQTELDGLADATIPVGGTTGQVLSKASGTNYDVGWVDQTGGGGGLGAAGAVEAHVTGTQSIPNNSATAVSFGATGTDDAGYWNVGTPTKLIVPAGYAGRHDVNALVEFPTNSTGNRSIAIYKNGSDITGLIRFAASPTNDTNIGISWTLDLEEGDEVEVYVSQTSGGALNVQPYTAIALTRLAVVDEINALQIQGRDVAATAPADGQVLAWNNTATEWQPADQSGGGTSFTENQFKTLQFNAAPAAMEFGIEIGAGTEPVVLTGAMDAAAIKAAIEASADVTGFTADVFGYTVASGGMHSGMFIVAMRGTEPFPAWGNVQNSEVQQFTVADGDGGNYTLNGGDDFIMGISESDLQSNQRTLSGEYSDVVVTGQSNATAVGGPVLVDGTASASGEFSGEYVAANAFDGDPETSWFVQDSPPRWLRYDRGVGALDLPVENYGIRTATNHKPTEWVLRTSPDATSWTNLDSKSGQTLASDTNTVFSVSGTVHRYVELVFTENSSSGISSQIAEFSVNSDTLPAAANMTSYFPFAVGDVGNPSVTGTNAAATTLHQGGSTSTMVAATPSTLAEVAISGLELPQSTAPSGAYTPANPSHWVAPPTTTTGALDMLAARINGMDGPV